MLDIFVSSAMDRRSFLKSLSVAGTILLAGCQEDDDSTPVRTPTSALPPETTRTPERTSTAEESPQKTPQTPESETPEMTPVAPNVSEGEEVSDVIAEIGEGELLEFPSGRFTWSSEALITVDNWGIRCQDDTVFEVPIGMGDSDGTNVITTYDGSSTADNVHLENLSFDSPGRAAPSIRLGVRNTARIDGLHYRMNGPVSDREHQDGLLAFVENADGEMRIDGYRQLNNGDLGAYGDGNSRVGIWVGPRNEGTIRLHNPVLQGFPNNACYVSRQPGTVIIEGGLLLNNNVSAVRVSGGVEVRNTTIYIDIDRYLGGPGLLETWQHNTRGVWGDNRQAGTDGGLVTGCSFILESYERCTGLATILENPQMTVRDSQFLLDTDIECVQAHNGEIEVENCDFAGRSSDSTAGVGEITGSGGHVAPIIDPGAVPLQGRNATFDWAKTHPETPNRPTYDCPSLSEFMEIEWLPDSQCGSRLL